MTKYKNEVPEMKKGDVRVMWNDGDGYFVVDFEKGPCQEVIKDVVNEYLKHSRHRIIKE